MNSIITFRWAFWFFWMISLHINFGQSCMHVTKKTGYVKPRSVIIDKTKLGVETGIDFMQNSKVEFYEELRFDNNPFGTTWHMQKEISTLDIVQKFLRKIKGLPETPHG